jgi:hypothetical protein
MVSNRSRIGYALGGRSALFAAVTRSAAKTRHWRVRQTEREFVRRRTARTRRARFMNLFA